jgi:N-acetylglucosaminyldiphosphoundecaprenol N-acetyl-beta-D-mannosaminyltransferase
MRKLLVVLGVPIDNLTMEEALERCDDFIADARSNGRTHQIATVNADFVVNSLNDPELRRILQEASMATADGMPLVWASRLLGGPIPGRVTGADLVPALAERAAQKGYSLFFLGAREGVAAQAAELLQARYPGLKIAGVLSPPVQPLLEMDQSVVEAVQAAKPDILFVAFGNPKQEKWIRMYANQLHVPIAIGIGGTLDMLVGITKRAPLWMQQAGLEWAYRMVQEPGRLLRRYLHDFRYFGIFFVRQWWAMRRGTAHSMMPISNEVAVAPAPPVEPQPAASLAPEDLPIRSESDLAEAEPQIATLECVGNLDIHNAQEIVAEAQRLLEGSRYLILDFSRLTFLDSSALGTLVSLANQARSRGGDIWFIAVPERIRGILRLTRLDQFFEIYEDRERAEDQLRAASVAPQEPRKLRGWQIIDLPRIVDVDATEELLERSQAALEQTPYLIWDMQASILLASAGMACMVKVHRLAESMGGALRIANVSPEIMRTLNLVKLDSFLALYSDLESALPPQNSSDSGSEFIQMSFSSAK